MNRRDFTHYAGEREKDALEVLRTPNVAVPAYQQAMRALGRTLGQIIPVDGQTLVVSTSEDADYLAKGCIESLKAREVAYKLAVFWNHHYTLPNGESIAPILNRYLQPGYRDCTRIILLKSIPAVALSVPTCLPCWQPCPNRKISPLPRQSCTARAKRACVGNFRPLLRTSSPSTPSPLTTSATKKVTYWTVLAATSIHIWDLPTSRYGRESPICRNWLQKRYLNKYT